MITGIHAILYSKHADGVRRFLAEVLELPSVDAGGGWPIFQAAPTELAVHPSDEAPEHELKLMCDDINATVANFAKRGMTTAGSVEDRGWGLLTTLVVPGERTHRTLRTSTRITPSARTRFARLNAEPTRRSSRCGNRRLSQGRVGVIPSADPNPIASPPLRTGDKPSAASRTSVRPNPTSVQPPSIRIGVDLGGTKIEILAIDSEGRALLRRRIPTPKNDYDATLQAITTLVVSVEQELACTGSVGIGTPGATSLKGGLIKNANSTVLIGKNFQRGIEQRLNREIRIANDGNCLALSEAIDGAGCQSRVVFGVILGTGVGGGIAVDGRILAGSAAVAGEWGHIPLPWLKAEECPGPLCYCGKFGCIETWLSGPALSAQFESLTAQRAIPTQIAAHALGGNRAAAKCLAAYEDRLARGLAAVINILDPNVIVLGGGLSNIDRFYASVPKLLAQYVFGREVGSTLQRAAFGDSSGVRGAALLWPGEDSSKLWSI